MGGDLNQRAAEAHKACTVLVSMGPAAEALATDEFGREKWAIAQEAMKLFHASANERSEQFANILGFMVKEVREAIPKYDGTDLGGSAGSPVRFVCLCVAGMPHACWNVFGKRWGGRVSSLRQGVGGVGWYQCGAGPVRIACMFRR